MGENPYSSRMVAANARSFNPTSNYFAWPRGILIDFPQLQNRRYQCLPTVGRVHSLDINCPLSLPFSNNSLKTPRTTNGSLCQCDSCDSWLHMDGLTIKSYLQSHLGQVYTALELWGSEHLSTGPVFSHFLHHHHASLPSQAQLPWLPLFKWEFVLMPSLMAMPDLMHKH